MHISPSIKVRCGARNRRDVTCVAHVTCVAPVTCVWVARHMHVLIEEKVGFEVVD